MSKENKRNFLFPRYLLPSKPPRKSSSTVTPSSQPHTDPKYLDGHISYLSCSECAVHLCLTSQIISKGFTGRHGRAYLVSTDPVTSAVSVSASSSATISLPNTILQRPVPRQLVTGAHTVSDVSCFCGSVLGWKYVAAEEESQRYKVGKFILETKKTMTTSCWESPPDDVQVPVPQKGESEEKKLEKERDEVEVEFDSQDEDECEDLFAGIWSAGLASRRRSRRVERKPMFSLS